MIIFFPPRFVRNALVATLLFLVSPLPSFADTPTQRLFKAASVGDVKELGGLLAQGVDPNTRNEMKDPVLFTAVYAGHMKLVCKPAWNYDQVLGVIGAQI